MCSAELDQRVDLVWLGPQQPPGWAHGDVVQTLPTPAAIRHAISELRSSSTAAWWLFWDGDLGPPDPTRVAAAIGERGDVKHAGLLLGLGGAPRALDFVSPLWMLNLDPLRPAQATSWRISFRACLMSSSVPDRAGLPDAGFSSLDASSVHYGHVAVRNGIVTRSTKALFAHTPACERVTLPVEDEIRFITATHGTRWAWWAAGRFIVTRAVSPLRIASALRKVRMNPPPALRRVPHATHKAPSQLPTLTSRSVSVVIPTLSRYPYLHKLLEQLREQTIPPLEILVVDQTPPAERERDLQRHYTDLPLRVFHLEKPGQCTARNLALAHARGDLVLFLDDDDELDELLFARHLANLATATADVSSGIVEEVGANEADPFPTIRRLSDVFPTNNTLAALDRIREVGSFDPAYDKGQRADHDLGMRLYLSGALMMLDPSIILLHHRAPRGGLRTHGARVTTQASSRSKLGHRNLPTVSDLYLGLKYYSADQVRESIRISLLATFRFRGPLHLRTLKALLALSLLPRSIGLVRARLRTAEALLREREQRSFPA